MSEKISLLLDGQMDPAEVRSALGELAVDPAARDRLTIYNLLGDVLRGNSTPDDGYTLRLLERLRAAGTRIEPGYDPLSG